jgi:tetratricopeptide (TPR) repeat protein
VEIQTPALIRAARRFLSTGRTPTFAIDAVASVCETIIRDESRRSLDSAYRLAVKFARRTARMNPSVRLVALRALSRVAHLSARYDEAREAYLAIRRLSQDDPLLVARVNRALIDIYMYSGSSTEARHCAKEAIRTFTRLGLASDVAMTRVNLANVLHRQDRHADAEELYEAAAEHFRGEDDELALARCLYNRANTLVQLFRLDEAEALYTESMAIYNRRAQALEATDARYGLAWLAMLKGAFHLALTELAACEAAYQTAGQPKGAALCELDRAEVYLGLNLFRDARDASRRSEKLFRSLGLRYEASKAALFRAKAAGALGITSEARKALDRAQQGFTEGRNEGFLGVAWLTRAQIAPDRRASRNSYVKARSLFRRSQLPLWQAVCDLQLAAGELDRPAALKRLAQSGAVQHVPHLYANWQTLRGDLASQTNISRARLHWRQAAERLDAVRAQLPPVDLRTGAGRLPADPHAKLVDSYIPEDPSLAAAWSERHRTAGIWSPLADLGATDSARRRAEESLAQLAAQVSFLSHRITSSSGERNAIGRQSRRLLSLQRSVRLDLLRSERRGTARVDSIESIRRQFQGVSSDQPIVQFHCSGRDLIAFVHENGTSRCVSFPDGSVHLGRSMREWRFLLETELLAQRDEQKAASDTERAYFADLGRWLWAPLRIPAHAPRVLILPEGDLANLPWQAIEVDGEPLLNRHHVVVCPSLRHFLKANAIRTAGTDVRLFVGSVVDLPAVDREIDSLRRGAGRHFQLHRPCHRDDWPSEGEARIWHFAGHAFLREDNPFYSYLALEDGPLFAADFRLRDVRLQLVTLAACRTGQQVALPGEETNGLVRSLLEMGARNVIAGHWPVADRSTALWMSTFYDSYFRDANLLAASRHADRTVREQFPSAYHWAAFAVFGAGE